MRVERVCCGRDERDPDTPVSTEARMLIWRMQADGFTFQLREDGRSVLVTPGERVTEADRAALTACFHEVKDLLREERVS